VGDMVTPVREKMVLRKIFSPGQPQSRNSLYCWGGQKNPQQKLQQQQQQPGVILQQISEFMDIKKFAQITEEDIGNFRI